MSSANNERPVEAQRAASDVPNRARRSEVGDQRPLFERTWSTSGVIDNGQPVAAAAAADGNADTEDANTAMRQMHQSWSTGPSSPWPTGGFDTSNRRGSTGSTLPPGLLSASNGAPPRPVAGHPNQPRVSKAMHDAALYKNWPKVVDICNQDPESASFVGPGGMTALHHICDRRCPNAEVAEAAIRACPENLTAESGKGWTPLHYAARNKCEEDVIKALLTMDPDKAKLTVSKPDRWRKTPLYYAVRYDAPAGVVPQLLRADPSVVLSGDLESPLVLIWDEFAEKTDGRRALHPFIGDPDNARTPEELRELLTTQACSELLKNWETANTFLKAAFGFPLSEEEELADTSGRRWRILHVTAAVKCHITLFQMACALYPEQAQEMDEMDVYGHTANSGENSRPQQTALHLAAASEASGADGLVVISTLRGLNPDAAFFADEIDGSYPLHVIAGNKHKQDWLLDSVQLLYEANPVALQVADRRGRLPLHRAAAAIVQKEETTDLAGQSVIFNLLQRHPAAASALDEDGCQPLHLIAMNGTNWDAEVQAVYEAHEGAGSLRTGRQLCSSLPIHLAAANLNAGRSLIERLVALNPRGVSQANGQGKFPLHLACEHGKEWVQEGTEIIFDAFAQAVSVREENERHWTALHMASASANTDCGELIKKLVELYPEACHVADSQGRYPLHLACNSGKNWEGGLSSLFDGNPTAIGSADLQGRLPLYIVADQYIATSGNTGSDSSETEDTTEAQSAFSRQADELDVLFHLVRSDPTTLPERR